MKRSILWLSFSSLLIGASAISLQAQDGVPSPKRAEMEQRNMQSHRDEDEAAYSPAQTSPADSSVSKLQASKENNKQPKKEGQESAQEDVLSFNFLYYIIQRFKMSDIVEE